MSRTNPLTSCTSTRRSIPIPATTSFSLKRTARKPNLKSRRLRTHGNGTRKPHARLNSSWKLAARHRRRCRRSARSLATPDPYHHAEDQEHDADNNRQNLRLLEHEQRTVVILLARRGRDECGDANAQHLSNGED